MKNCNKCSTVKPLFMYHKHLSSKDGLQSYCKPCHNEESKTSRRKLTKIKKDNLLLRLAEIPNIKLPDIEYN